MRATAANGICRASIRISASNSSVKPDRRPPEFEVVMARLAEAERTLNASGAS